MRHFVDDEYDSLAEYEAHVGGPHYEKDEEDHGMMWREEYEHEYDDYGKSMLNHD